MKIAEQAIGSSPFSGTKPSESRTYNESVNVYFGQKSVENKTICKLFKNKNGWLTRVGFTGFTVSVHKTYWIKKPKCSSNADL